MRKDKSIILEGKTHGSYSYPDLLVSMYKSLFDKDSYQQHEELHKKNSFMLHPRQFVDFLNLIKTGKAYDGNGKKIPTEILDVVLGEIINVRDPWRMENLDAYFSDKNKVMHVTYHKINSDGKFEKITEELQDCLMIDKYIDLEDYLKNANEQGLPYKNVNQGKSYYFFPRDGAVAGFVAGSGGAVLGCGRGPSNSDSSLEVRSAKIFHRK